ncbi:MAG: SDR family oxidoreductase [Chloroflexi bacterium]|jgi:2-dehydro-3-deoxy-D-gluconate 5-dehydrogenase|nr:SDR family oxidoreductase [Chloroflexota bacterium]
MATISELFDLSGKSTIVTGGGTGIGQAISMRLAEAGASVMITDINLEAGNQTVEMIKADGGKAQAIQADASSSSDAKKTAQATIDAFGRIDILVNNAGIYPVSPVMEISEALWDRVLDLNLKGTFLYAQSIAEVMIKTGQGGKIINMASVDGMRPTGLVAHYNASKGGVIMLTKAMALELAPHRILVNAVAPGGIITTGTAQTGVEMQQATGKSLEQMAEDISKRMPLGRMGEPDEVARVVLFLASRCADYMTGEIVVVDGGYLLS